MDSPLFVFVHGFLGFDGIRVLGRRIDYFRDLDRQLGSLGLWVFFPELPSTGTVPQRARALAEQLDAIPARRVKLIAHSMGGLDCRYYIHHLDPRRRVRSLATVATPHRGSPLAAWLLESRGAVQWIGRRWLRDGLESLTPQSLRRFNEQVPDRPDVRYISYAGVRPVAEMPPWFRAWTRIVAAEAGDNDSQVPLSSAVWGEFKGSVRADHLELAGWNLGWPDRHSQRPFDHLGFYRRVIAELLADAWV